MFGVPVGGSIYNKMPSVIKAKGDEDVKKPLSGEVPCRSTQVNGMPGF
jgi:hypothetical protein